MHYSIEFNNQLYIKVLKVLDIELKPIKPYLRPSSEMSEATKKVIGGDQQDFQPTGVNASNISQPLEGATGMDLPQKDSSGDIALTQLRKVTIGHWWSTESKRQGSNIIPSRMLDL